MNVMANRSARVAAKRPVRADRLGADRSARTFAVDSQELRIRRKRPVSEIGKPEARSYFAAAPAFRDGTDTPRAFLERCITTIEALEPQVGAFVATNLS